VLIYGGRRTFGVHQCSSGLSVLVWMGLLSCIGFVVLGRFGV